MLVVTEISRALGLDEETIIAIEGMVTERNGLQKRIDLLRRIGQNICDPQSTLGLIGRLQNRRDFLDTEMAVYQKAAQLAMAA